MDRYEYNILLEKLNQFVQEEDYVAALGLVEEVDWRRVRNTRTLIMVSEVYEKNQRLEDAKDILLLAYERTTVGRSILYRLVEVAIAMDSPDEALEYYMEYSLLYPNEPAKYILKYKVWQARGASYEEQIQALETYKEHEYNEKWIYELASLYEKNGQEDKAVAACDEVILWFADGEYVQKAMDLKRNYTPLTAEEELKYKEAMVKKEISGDNFFDEACDPDEEEPLEGRRIEVKTGMDTADIREDLIGEMTSFTHEIQEADVSKLDSTEDKPSSEENLSEDLLQNIHLKGRQEEASAKAGSIALNLEEGVLETIEEAKKRQLQIEEETRKNRDALSEAMTMQDIEALVEASEARKESERIANSQPKEYEEEELEVLHKNVADGLEEFADLLKTKDVWEEPTVVDSRDNTVDLSKVIKPQEEIDKEDKEDENYIPGQLSFDKLLAQMNKEEETKDILKESQDDLREGISSFVEEMPVEDTPSISQEDSLDDLDIGLGLEDFLQSVVAYSQEDISSTLPESDSSTSSGEILESINQDYPDKVSEREDLTSQAKILEEGDLVSQAKTLESDDLISQNEEIESALALEIEAFALEEEPKSQDKVLQEDMPQEAKEEVAVSMEDIHFALEDFLVDLDQEEEKQEAKEEDVFDLEQVLEQEMSTSITEDPIKGDMPDTDNPLNEEEELTQEQKEILSYFAPIPGITSQVAQVLAEVRRKGYDFSN